MRVSGFGIANHVIRLGYPLEASLRSMLPLVDEVILNIGQDDDETWNLVASLGEPKIKPFRSFWDPSIRAGGAILAQQTNLALERCRGDWGLYLQADEVLHERDYPILRRAMERYADRPTEALRLRYYHFYGSYRTIQDAPAKWYTRAIRVVKLGIGAVSRGDAMDFGLRRDGRDWNLRHANINAFVYHYGWSRPPEVMRAKQDKFERLYHDDEAFHRAFPQGISEDVYNERGNLRFFRGDHPAVMRERIAGRQWDFDDGIQSQPPDWLRHAAVWTRHYIRRALPYGRKQAQRLERTLLGAG